MQLQAKLITAETAIAPFPLINVAARSWYLTFAQRTLVPIGFLKNRDSMPSSDEPLYNKSGMISQYNVPDKEGVRNLFAVTGKRILIQGFIIADYMSTMGPQFSKDMSQWLKEGKVNSVEDVTSGLENAPKAFIGMLHGKNVGKAAVKVAKP